MIKKLESTNWWSRIRKHELMIKNRKHELMIKKKARIETENEPKPEDYSEVVNDPQVLQSVLESLPGVKWRKESS